MFLFQNKYGDPTQQTLADKKSTFEIVKSIFTEKNFKDKEYHVGKWLNGEAIYAAGERSTSVNVSKFKENGEEKLRIEITMTNVNAEKDLVEMGRDMMKKAGLNPDLYTFKTKSTDVTSKQKIVYPKGSETITTNTGYTLTITGPNETEFFKEKK